jgi:hypothetical protein
MDMKNDEIIWNKINTNFYCECGNKLTIVDIAIARLKEDKEYIVCKCGKLFSINQLYDKEI